MFYEFHNYEVKMKMHHRMILLLLTNFVASLVTNPIDVCLSKLATQQPTEVEKTLKYRGFLDCMRTVYKEEGLRKLFLGGLHPRFMFNFANGIIFLYIYETFISQIERNP